jgi:hypothetical protein
VLPETTEEKPATGEFRLKPQKLQHLQLFGSQQKTAAKICKIAVLGARGLSANI